MANFKCANPKCSKNFISKHSTAKFCSRECAAKINIAKNQKFLSGAPKKYTDKQLIQMIVDWHIQTGKVPSGRDFQNSEGHPDPTTYRERFVTWNNAVVIAGLTPHAQYGKSFYENDRSLLTPSLRYDVLSRDRFKCVCCGRSPATEDVVLHVDHIIAVANGGKTTLNNLRSTCSLCNSGKSDKRG